MTFARCNTLHRQWEGRIDALRATLTPRAPLYDAAVQAEGFFGRARPMGETVGLVRPAHATFGPAWTRPRPGYGLCAVAPWELVLPAG